MTSATMFNIRLTRPNRRTGIASLPPELLVDIFKFAVATASFSTLYNEEIPTGSLHGHLYQCTLLRITHVCDHWRNTAIGCQRLWTKIWPCEQHKDFVSLALERSRQCPLEVYLPGRHFHETEFVRGACPTVFSTLFGTEVHRIAALECGGLSYRLLRRHLPPGTTVAPALRRLRVDGGALKPWLCWRFPRLENLHIACSRTSRDAWREFWANAPLGSIRRLTIGIVPPRPFAEPTLSADDMFDLLRRMPQLEALCVSIGRSKAEGADVELPRLQELMVAGDVTGSAGDANLSLLRKLIVPSTTIVTTGFTTRKLGTHALAQVPPMMRAIELRQWALYLGPLQSLFIAFHDTQTDGYFSVMLAGEVTRRHPDVKAFAETASELRWCAEHFELKDVTTLTLVMLEFCEDGEMLDAIRRFCERLTNVRRVNLRSAGSTGQARSANVEKLMAEIADGSIFPKLESR